MNMKATAIGLASGFLLLLIMVPGAKATGPDDFMLKSTEDFIDICETSQAETVYTAAVHFCHGYAVGVFQYYQTLTAEGGGELVCLPDPRPTRTEAIKRFMAWAKSNPQYMSRPAAETIMRYLIEEHGCR